jgi:hypothetical protein
MTGRDYEQFKYTQQLLLLGKMETEAEEKLTIDEGLKKQTIVIAAIFFISVAAVVGLFSDIDGDGLSNSSEFFSHGTDFLELDTDWDGLNDKYELDNKLDPNEPDSDFDGLSDGREVKYIFSDPLSPDTDDDKLSDGEEVNEYHTSPLNSDTDGDGLSDRDEVILYLTNPLKEDSDGDDINDNEEINNYGTNPNLADTDADGLTDGEEITTYFTNPLVMDTDADGLSDGIEIQSTNSNPLSNDTDGDGVKDGDDINPNLDVNLSFQYGYEAYTGDSFSAPDVYFIFYLRSTDGVYYSGGTSVTYVDISNSAVGDTGTFTLDWDDTATILEMTVQAYDADTWNADEVMDLGPAGSSQISFNIDFSELSDGTIVLDFTPEVAFDQIEGHPCNFSIHLFLSPQ